MRRRFRSTAPSNHRAFTRQAYARKLRFESMEARALLSVSAGGPYSINEGQSLQLDGSGTRVPVSNGAVFWTDTSHAPSQSLRTATQDGQNVEALVGDLVQPRGMAIDELNGFAYWAEPGALAIRRVRIDGAASAEHVVDVRNGAAGVALDISRGKMYWTDSDVGEIHAGERGGKVRRANLDGSNPEDVVIGLSHPVGIAIDPVGSQVYWSDLEGTIQSAQLDGSDIHTVATGVDQANGLVVDYQHGKLYWAESELGNIQRANVDGSELETLISGLSPTSLAINVESQTLYWSEESLGTIRGENFDGSGEFTIVSTAGQPWGIATYSGLSYSWDLDGDGDFDDANGITPVVPWNSLTDLGLDDDGDYTVALRVSSEGNVLGENSTTVTIKNSVPSITSLELLPSTVTEGGGLSADGSYAVFTSISTEDVIARSLIAIDNFGSVLGSFSVDGGPTQTYLRKKDGTLELIAIPGRSITGAVGMNNLGQIVGHVLDPTLHFYRTYLRQPDGSFEEFDVPSTGGSQVGDINDLGQIVGVRSNGDVFVRQLDGTFDFYDVPGNIVSGGSFGINNDGLVTGSDGVVSFVLDTRTGESTEVVYPGATQTQLYGINNHGQAAGLWYAEGAGVHGFVRNVDGTFVDVIFPIGAVTTLHGINDFGQVVGAYYPAENTQFGFIASPISQPTQLVKIVGAISDSGVDDTFAVTIDWGDGSTSRAALGQDGKTFNGSHVFLDDDPSGTPTDAYSVAVSVVDDDGGIASQGAIVVVDNAAPTSLVLESLSPIDIGELTTLKGTFTDLGILDTHQITIEWGDGQTTSLPLAAGARHFEIAHIYADRNPANEFTIHVTVTDDDVGSVSADTSQVIINSPPAIFGLGVGPGLAGEGELVVLTGQIEDADVLDGHVVYVDWGDGSHSEATVDVDLRRFDASHVYLDGDVPSNSHVIAVRVIDDAGNDAEAVTGVTVNDVAPTIALNGPTTIAEGANYSLTLGPISDPGVDTVVEWIVHWGDGTVQSYATSGVKSHQYANGPTNRQIVVDLRDEDGLHLNAGTRSVTVTNVAPLFANLSVVDGVEGGPTRLLGSIVDPGSIDNFSVEVNWGDGSPLDVYAFSAGQRRFDLSHRYVDDDPSSTPSDLYSIALAVRDQDGGTSTGGATARVFNVAPGIVALNASASTINEGDVVQVTGTIVDPGLRDSFVLTVNWGDGMPVESFPLAAQSGFFVVSHSYLNDPPGQTTQFRPTFTLTDDDQGSDSEELAIEVRNVSPRDLLLIPSAAIVEGSSISLRGTFHDLGAADTFVVTVDWGDGSLLTSVPLPAGSAAFEFPHRYLDDASVRVPNEFPITVTVADADGGSVAGATRALVTNAPPIVTILGAPNVVGVGTELSLESHVVDPGTQDTFRYAWQVRKDGELIAEGDEADFSYLPEGPGVFVVSLQVLDDDQGAGTAVVSVIVVPCFLPGDTNADCAVDLADLNNVRNHFGDTGLGAVDLAFNSPTPGTLLDRNSVGSGFSARLPGTGASVPVSDPNMDVLSSPGRLLLKSTNGSLASRQSWDGLETPGVLLEGVEANDLRLSLALQNVRMNAGGDALQLYAGESANKIVLAGVLGGDRFTVVSRVNGLETTLFLSPANSYTPGDNITLVLSRTAELWRLNWVNLTNPAASGASPAFALTSLNTESDLYAGVYAANAPDTVPFTAFIDYFTFDDLATIPGDTNGNHVVDLGDLNAVRNHFGASFPSPISGALPSMQRRGVNDERALDRIAADAVFGQLAAVYQEWGGSSPVSSRRQTRANLPRLMTRP